MFKLRHVSPEEAEGQIADIYSSFPKETGVPRPLLLTSVSPELMKRQFEIMRYYMTHPTLSFHLPASIRYLVAADRGFEYCVKHNSAMLATSGLARTTFRPCSKIRLQRHWKIENAACSPSWLTP
jgi:hypothetical protein